MFNFFIVLGSLHSRPRCKEWCFVKVDHTEQIWTYLDHGCWWRCLSHLRVSLVFMIEIEKDLLSFTGPN